MSKFKIGDRVIVVDDHDDEGLILVTGTVVEDDDDYPYVILDDISRYPNPSAEIFERGWAILEEHMEHEHIYNSPLAKALL